MHSIAILAARGREKAKQEIDGGRIVTFFRRRFGKSLPGFAIQACALAFMFMSALPAYSGELVRIPVRESQTQAIFIDQPSGTPPWVVVLFGYLPHSAFSYLA